MQWPHALDRPPHTRKKYLRSQTIAMHIKIKQDQGNKRHCSHFEIRIGDIYQHLKFFLRLTPFQNKKQGGFTSNANSMAKSDLNRIPTSSTQTARRLVTKHHCNSVPTLTLSCIHVGLNYWSWWSNNRFRKTMAMGHAWSMSSAIVGLFWCLSHVGGAGVS